MQTDFVSEIASFLLKTNSLQFGVFKLTSGKESPYYIDLRTIASFPRYFRLTIGSLRDKIATKIGLEFDSLGSIPTSGLVFGSALAYEIVKPLLYVRKEPKGHGIITKMIEGYLKPGGKVLVVDDVATTGISTSYAVDVIRSNGGVVENVLAIVSRLEGAEENLRQKGVNFISLTTIKEIASVLNNKGLIDENILESVLKYKFESETN
jgi:orotate phosphoribosyltransferase